MKDLVPIIDTQPHSLSNKRLNCATSIDSRLFDQLCELLVAKPKERLEEQLPTAHWVVGLNPSRLGDSVSIPSSILPLGLSQVFSCKFDRIKRKDVLVNLLRYQKDCVAA